MNIVPHINALFAPRPPLEFKQPYSQQVGKKRKLPYEGIAKCLENFETPDEYEENFKKFKPIEQRKERRERIAEERKTLSQDTVKAKAAAWDPSSYSFESDAYKTLFVGRLSFMTDEHKLKREMEQDITCLIFSLSCD